MTHMSTQPGLMTAEKLLTLPDDMWQYELLDGELQRMTKPGALHGRVAAEVGASLTTFVRNHDLGLTFAAETGFLLRKNPDTVRAPDASFISHVRLAATPFPLEKFYPGAPDLAIEVLSPSDSARKVRSKVADWLACGSAAVLVLDPKRKVAELHRAGRVHVYAPPEVLMLDDVLPGWSLDLADLFR